MAQQIINIGSTPNDGTGDTIRNAFDKTNDNFDEIYDSLTFGTNNITVANTLLIGNSTINSTMNSSSLVVSANVNVANIVKANSTVLSVGSNVTVNTTTMFFGNSTVNTFITSSIVRTGTANVVTNTGLILGSSTKAANGYTFLPNGLKLNWGWVSSNTTVGNATFTSAYTTLYNVSVTANSTVSTYQPAIISSNSTVAVIRTGNATASNIMWTAIGV